MGDDRDVRVSVVLASRDGARWFPEQLASILEQTRPVDEVVVVDDASVDGTTAMARAAGPPVRLVEREKPLGVIRNFEDGLRRATGDVILLSDQDDVWEPTKVGRILEVLAAHPDALAVFSDAEEIDAEGALVGRRLWQAAGLDDAALAAWESDPLGHELRGNCVTGAAMALRREALDLVLPFPETGWHDGWMALVLTGARGPGSVVALRECLMRYRVHGSNASGGLVPPGRWAGLRWYVRRGAAAESVDLGQLPAAIERLRSLGADASRLEHKLTFMRSRRSLPRGMHRRWRIVRSRVMTEGYARFTVGRLPALLDVVRGR